MKNRKETGLEQKRMNFLVFSSDRFLKSLIILVKSIVVNHKNRAIRVYAVLDSDNFASTSKKLVRLFKNEKTLSLRTIDLNSATHGEFDCDCFTSLKLYFRQGFYRLLPQLFVEEEDDRVLYLDCDMLCNGDLSPFYDVDFNGKSICVVGIARDGNNGGPEKTFPVHYEGVAIPIEEEIYFNSGVILYNMGKMRSRSDLYGLYRSIATKYFEEIHFGDQDIANLVFLRDKLSIINNCFNFCVQDRDRLNRRMKKYVLTNVTLFHFAGHRKPWFYWNYSNPLFFLYNKYYSRVYPGFCFRILVFAVTRLWPYYRVGMTFPAWIKHFFHKSQ